MAENMEVEIEANNEAPTAVQSGSSTGPNIEQMQISADNAVPSTSRINTSVSVSANSTAPGSLTLSEPVVKVKLAQSDHSEFDSSDDRDYFDIWSSGSSSEDSSGEENSADRMDIDGEMAAKRKKKNEQGDRWDAIQEPGRICKFNFTGASYLAEFTSKEKITPLLCFQLFVNEDVINLLTNETNRYARSKFIRPSYHKDFLSGWMDVTSTEMLELIGLLVFMNFRRLPGTKYYWSSERDMSTPVAGYIMTETRFKRLMTFWHFGDDNGEEFSKITGLINLLNKNFAQHKSPGHKMYVGKRTIYMRERYAKQKKTEGVPVRGLKLLRLVDDEAYTYKVALIPPANNVERSVRDKSCILKLLQNYLDVGRIFIFDNIFISVDIADTLLKRQSHAVGKIRKKSRGTPEEFCKLQVQQKEIQGFQNQDGISIYKWQIDDSKGCGLSTCHGCETEQIESQEKQDKTVAVSQSEFFKDYSNRLRAFETVKQYSISNSPVNGEITWYRRLANDLITGICVSNAYHLYRKLSNDKSCQFYKFQDQLWKQLVGFTWLLQGETSGEDG